MAISAAAVKELRDKTGIGMMDCKEALVATNGDMEKAVEFLRKKGMAAADKRAGRAAGEGVIGSYIHSDGKIGVMVELNCETDFVARNEEFRALAKDLAMQVAASPQTIAVRREEVPAELIAKEREIAAEQVKGKPAAIMDKIVDGKMNKFYEERCLMEQPFVKDSDKKVEDLVKNLTGKIGEKIFVRRFARFAVGEEIK
jgi:elongation factor Ts